MLSKYSPLCGELALIDIIIITVLCAGGGCGADAEKDFRSRPLSGSSEKAQGGHPNSLSRLDERSVSTKLTLPLFFFSSSSSTTSFKPPPALLLPQQLAAFATSTTWPSSTSRPRTNACSSLHDDSSPPPQLLARSVYS